MFLKIVQHPLPIPPQNFHVSVSLPPVRRSHADRLLRLIIVVSFTFRNSERHRVKYLQCVRSIYIFFIGLFVSGGVFELIDFSYVYQFLSYCLSHHIRLSITECGYIAIFRHSSLHCRVQQHDMTTAASLDVTTPSS